MAIDRGPLRAFKYPQFRLLWGASFFSISSFFMIVITRGWLVLVLTDSAFLVTAVNAVPMIPLALIAPIGGVLADRLNKRSVLMVGESLNFIIVMMLAALVLTNVVQIWHIFVLSFLHGALFAIVMPTRMTVVPELMSQRDLASGVALFTTIFSSAQLAGPAPAGYLINAFGVGFALLIAGLMLVPAFLIIMYLRIPPTENSIRESVRESIPQSIKIGLSYVQHNSFILGTILLGVVFAIFGMPYQAILPVFARDVLHSSANGLGLLGMGVGVGALTGSIAVASFSNLRQIWLLMIGGALGFGVLLVLFAWSGMFWVSFFLTIILGWMMQVSLTSNFTLVQLVTPDHIRGRVLSIRMLAVGVGPIGMFLLGIGTEWVGPQSALAIFGALSGVFTLIVMLGIPAIRNPDVNLMTSNVADTGTKQT